MNKLSLLLCLFVLIPLPMIFAQTEPPYRITYTITDFLSVPNKYDVTILEQEAMVQKVFNHWTKHINAKAIYMKGANPVDVVCAIAIKPVFTTGGALGIGSGNGPNTKCFAVVKSTLLLYLPPKPPFDGFVNYNMEAIMAHEIGHGLGLGHYNLGSCIVYTYYATSMPAGCAQEIYDLKKLWFNAKCTIPQCLTVPAITDGEVTRASIIDLTITQGEKIRIDYTISNIGNVQVYSTFLIIDQTDGKTLKFAFEPPLLPGESRNGFIIFDTTTSSIGMHKILVYFSPLPADIDKTNNRKYLDIEILDPNPIPPDPVNYNVTLNDGIMMKDSGKLEIHSIRYF